MPASLALALTLIFVGYLLLRDVRAEPRVSAAVWIPVIWLGISGSRSVSGWMGSGTDFSAQAMQSLSEGSPIDKAIYSALIFAGVCVLASRRIRLGEIARNNLAITLFLAYTLASVLWSDYPLTSLKRWAKAFGDPVMILVLWTDPTPIRAVTATIKRCAYVLIPLSVLFVKYFPELGRTIDIYGNVYLIGVATDKNLLGYLLFASGLFFIAAIATPKSPQDALRALRFERWVSLVLLAMIVWLLPISDSKTATLALIAGTGVIVALRFDFVRRHFWSVALSVVLLLGIGDALFSISDSVFEASGRDATFTGRTTIWATVLSEPINPLLGAGYGSFWLGERLARYWAMFPNSPLIQAHNGYIEVYINLGLLGLSLVIGILWSGLRRIRSRASFSLLAASSSGDNNSKHYERVFALFGLAYGVSYLLYNVTEATLQGMNFLFTIFLILSFNPGEASQALDVPRANSKMRNHRGLRQARSEAQTRKAM